MSELPEITDVQRLRLEPGDSLVLHTNVSEISPEQADAVKEKIRAALGIGDDTRILLLTKGVNITVASK